MKTTLHGALTPKSSHNRIRGHREVPVMPWYQLDNPHDPKLDELARQYNLHPLHIEDVRSEDESVKVDSGAHYTFAVFKPTYLRTDPNAPGEDMPTFTTIDVFA